MLIYYFFSAVYQHSTNFVIQNENFRVFIAMNLNFHFLHHCFNMYHEGTHQSLYDDSLIFTRPK